MPFSQGRRFRIRRTRKIISERTVRDHDRPGVPCDFQPVGHWVARHTGRPHAAIHMFAWLNEDKARPDVSLRP